MHILPHENTSSPLWGIVTLCCVHLRGEARHSAELVSQAVMGTPVNIVDETDEWYKIVTPDGYESWTHKHSLAVCTTHEMMSWRNSERYIYTASCGYIYDAPAPDAPVVSDMVMGCIVVSSGYTAYNYIAVTTPDGRSGYISTDEVARLDYWAAQEPDMQRMECEARLMMGSTYLWGGTSTKGADCSGFSKLLYFSQGIILQRDASQQALHGEAVAPYATDLQRGDLLFFSNEKGLVNHVAIYLNEGLYIHASGCVKVNSMEPHNSLYNHRTVTSARRIVTSHDDCGIIRVADHPWYF